MSAGLKVLQWFGAVWVAGILLWVTYEYTVNEPKASVMEKELEKELSSIRPVDGAKPAVYSAMHKPSYAHVRRAYRTGASYSEIRAHYDAELVTHGWIFYEEMPAREPFRGSGAKEAWYCKGTYRVELEYAGKDANLEWDYALELRWGMDGILDTISGKFEKLGCR
jgi:hypothetical protein